MYRISCVKYTNSLPFVYGLKESKLIKQSNLSLDTPSDCYNKLANNEVDIGLVPVIALRKLKNTEILTNFCIGAKSKVNSVLLISPSNIKDIEKIFLDYQSRTSVELIKILCRKYWKINPEFLDTKPGFVKKSIADKSAFVVIGDRAFPFLNDKYKIYDLAESWKNYSGKPFVFACWLANKPIDNLFKQDFEKALQYGLLSRDQIIMDIEKDFSRFCIDLNEYFYHNINYNFDPDSIEGMELFLNLVFE